ncbi:PREDICTED: uncharacterized protein LOC109225285 [Nicotiana attenuata]|uniref:DUF506 domain-containing protein n=1 Tax=Nicotiana attenuata TaxID=49451 RepID=A0A1J6IEU5_NICAT|nr:PREDICTED: uncharacterized protein LOC109225285 [Nicotiana attenuata]OIT03146.1 hypothetical protein A4A49_33428 [Nicotiana attenuata]
MRFKRVAAAFDDVAKARFCESSGSEHSSVESVTDLYGLVNSFIERGNGFRGGRNEEEIINDDNEKEENGLSNNYFDDLEIKEKLRKLLGYEESDYVKRNIYSVVENAWLEIGDRSTAEFKRRLMIRLRDRGFDAGLCKSKWERNGQLPSGNYEYIDINMNENRYIIEVYLAREFEIARPTPYYTSLLEIFPSIFVGKVEELKQVVKLMSRATKKSMKKMDIHVPPWRQLSYMQAKWFGSYKRTINELLLDDDNKNLDFSYKCLAKKRAVGFVSMPTISFYCRENFGSNNGIKVGNLAAALNG